MPRIVLYRPKEYNNRFRNYQIYINNKKAGVIADDETVEFNVPEGLHTIRAGIDWCGSKELIVQLNENDTKRLLVSGFKLGTYLIPLTASVIVLHYLLKFTINLNFIIVFAIPGLLILAYYLTVGRNNYLTLEEQSEVL